MCKHLVATKIELLDDKLNTLNYVVVLKNFLKNYFKKVPDSETTYTYWLLSFFLFGVTFFATAEAFSKQMQ